MSLTAHAERELAILAPTPDEMQAEMNRHVLTMVKTFAEEGHSGFSAAYAVGLLEKLLRFEPLTPLTGADDEWMDTMGDGEMLQNVRCSHVFRGRDGRAYDIQGKVFVEPDGCAFTSGDSRVYIEFPYTPKTEYVKVKRDDA